MSASNWAFCPRCMAKRKMDREARWAEIEAMYGVAPVEEFDAARREFHDSESDGIREEKDETFREDYEISGISSGTLHIRYKGACEACGLAFAVKYDHEVFDPSKEHSS